MILYFLPIIAKLFLFSSLSFLFMTEGIDFDVLSCCVFCIAIVEVSTLLWSIAIIFKLYLKTIFHYLSYFLKALKIHQFNFYKIEFYKWRKLRRYIKVILTWKNLLLINKLILWCTNSFLEHLAFIKIKS